MMNYSFIIPVYNCKAYLRTCVQSIWAAGLTDYEILLVDDGSTDGSGAVCDALAEEFPHIRVIHKENGGVSSARNRGIREAEGERVLFIDADDTIDPAALGAVLADSRCAAADMTIFGLTFDYYYDGRCYRRDPLFFEYDGVMDKKCWSPEFQELFIRNSLSPVWNKVFRREILQAHGLELDTGMFLYEDFEFVLRYMAYCDTIFNVPQAIYHYRQSEDEGNAQRRLARIDCLSDFMAPIAAAVNGLPGVPGEQKEDVLVRLYQTLAREKISGSDLKQIGKICEDYSNWYRAGGCTAGDNGFHRDLMDGKNLKLLLRDRKTALRHRIAVWVKSHYLYRRK